MLLLLEQLLNGVQLGVTLLLMASGLTLIFGIMNLINLAHGSLFMVGAYVAATVSAATGSFLLGLLAGTVAAGVTGMVVELVVIRRLYARDHLDQVLATFGLILFFNELVRVVWGRQPLRLDVPPGFWGRSRWCRVRLIPSTGWRSSSSGRSWWVGFMDSCSARAWGCGFARGRATGR